MTHGPSVKETQDHASTEIELAPIAMTPIPTEEVVPLATPMVTRETKANVGNVGNVLPKPSVGSYDKQAAWKLS
jgi:hypothetical protein